MFLRLPLQPDLLQIPIHVEPQFVGALEIRLRGSRIAWHAFAAQRHRAEIGGALGPFHGLLDIPRNPRELPGRIERAEIGTGARLIGSDASFSSNTALLRSAAS